MSKKNAGEGLEIRVLESDTKDLSLFDRSDIVFADTRVREVVPGTRTGRHLHHLPIQPYAGRINPSETLHIPRHKAVISDHQRGFRPCSAHNRHGRLLPTGIKNAAVFITTNPLLLG